MGRAEVVIFASPEPVGRDVLARVVGRICSIDLLIDDIREELRGRPMRGRNKSSAKSYAKVERTVNPRREPA